MDFDDEIVKRLSKAS